MNRPEWVKCVGTGHALDREARKTCCGRTHDAFEWTFLDPTHAYLTMRAGRRFAACPECVDEITKVLRGQP
jgi:hypothetical protein